MLHAGYIKHLQYLDDMETEIITDNPIPITYNDIYSDKLREIKEYKKYIIIQFAASLGMKCEELI